MCQMINLFLPRKAPALGPPVRGLRFDSSGEIQRDFLARFAPESGVFLAGTGGAGCLCGFDDWSAFYLTAEDLLVRNALAWIAGLLFWSRDRYELRERVVDPDDAESCTGLELGEVVVVRPGPPEQRRHRLLVRDLGRLVGKVVSIRLKNGDARRDILETFDTTSEIGTIDGVFVVAAQVLALAESRGLPG